MVPGFRPSQTSACRRRLSPIVAVIPPSSALEVRHLLWCPRQILSSRWFSAFRCRFCIYNESLHALLPTREREFLLPSLSNWHSLFMNDTERLSLGVYTLLNARHQTRALSFLVAIAPNFLWLLTFWGSISKSHDRLSVYISIPTNLVEASKKPIKPPKIPAALWNFFFQLYWRIWTSNRLEVIYYLAAIDARHIQLVCRTHRCQQFSFIWTASTPVPAAILVSVATMSSQSYFYRLYIQSSSFWSFWSFAFGGAKMCAKFDKKRRNTFHNSRNDFKSVMLVRSFKPLIAPLVFSAICSWPGRIKWRR